MQKELIFPLVTFYNPGCSVETSCLLKQFFCDYEKRPKTLHHQYLSALSIKSLKPSPNHRNKSATRQIHLDINYSRQKKGHDFIATKSK